MTFCIRVNLVCSFVIVIVVFSLPDEIYKKTCSSFLFLQNRFRMNDWWRDASFLAKAMNEMCRSLGYEVVPPHDRISLQDLVWFRGEEEQYHRSLVLEWFSRQMNNPIDVNTNKHHWHSTSQDFECLIMEQDTSEKVNRLSRWVYLMRRLLTIVVFSL